MDGGSVNNPRTVEEVFKDFNGRRNALIKALTTDVEEFLQQCDPEKENLCLYGFPTEQWEVTLPAEEVPPELPEPALGINFARDGMEDKDWLAVVAVHSDAWLLSVAFYFGSRFGFDKADRKRLFNVINDLTTISEVVTGAAKKQVKEKSSASNHSGTKSKSNSKQERELESQKEDPMSKPEQFRSKIVDGRLRTRLEELSLLEQPFIKNDKVVVKDWVKQTISTVGENIKVKRFVHYNLGEGLEKKSQDFAAEVAAQTTSKPVSASVIQEPAADSQIREIIEETPKIVVSAALVKQLREESGAGLMDCKKALSESGGDLEKAQEYLTKKSLSTADKKSSRLAPEGRIVHS